MKEGFLMGLLLVSAMLIIVSIIVTSFNMLIISEALFVLALVLISKHKPKKLK
jgi:hypothetical protein